MRFGDTLSADKFDGFKFDYCISNPPFGDPWNPQAAAVEKEFKTAGGGRFPVEKLPAKGDGQMLFVLNGLSKLKDDGVMAIIQDASPLYKGKPAAARTASAATCWRTTGSTPSCSCPATRSITPASPPTYGSLARRRRLSTTTMCRLSTPPGVSRSAARVSATRRTTSLSAAETSSSRHIPSTATAPGRVPGPTSRRSPSRRA